jgi:acetyl esterase/lipase
MKEFHGFVPPPVKKEILDAIKEKHLDIPYSKSSKHCLLDLYLPNERKSLLTPVIVYFHGGAFAFGEKDDDALEPMLRGIDKGYAVISVQYRMSGEARFPAMIYDAKAAIRFVRSIASQYKLDPNKIAVWGPSSGGYLVSMLGVTANNPAFEDKENEYSSYSSEVNLVIDWCGPCENFIAMDEELKVSRSGTPDHDEPSSPESKFLGQGILTNPSLVRMAAPLTYVHKGMPPFLIVHGGADQVVPVEQSQHFYEAIKKMNGQDNVELFIAKGEKHHGAPWYHEVWLSDICFSFIARFFK